MGIVQRDSFRVALITYAGAAIGYLNKVFLFTNFLDTDQVGLANLMITISLIYAQVAALGSRSIITRFFPFFHDEKQNHHGFFFGVLAFSSAGFVLATLLFVALRKPFAWVYADSGPLLIDYALYLIPLSLATLFFNLFESYLRCLFKNSIPTIAHEVILRLLITLAISLYALGMISFPAFVFIYVLSYCVPAIVLIIYSLRKRLWKISSVYTPLFRRLGKIMLVYGLYSLLNNLSGFLLVSVDSLMVAGMLDLGKAGIYTTMVFMTSVMLIPYRSMVKVSGPLIAGYWKSRDMLQMQAVYSKATSANLVVGAALFMLLWVNLDSIFHFMAPEYKAGRFVFLMLGIGKLFDMSAGLNATILMTSKKYRYDLFFTVSMVIFAIVSNRLFIPLWGIEGAAFASMLTLIIFNIVRIAFIQYHFRIRPFAWRQLPVPVIMAIVMFFSGQIDAMPHVIVDVTIRSTMAAMLFLIPVWLLNVSPELNRMAEETIKRMIPGKKDT